MQTIEGKIEQLRAEVSRLQGELEILEKAQALLNGSEPVKRRGGRPKGSKNKATIAKGKSRRASKKTGGRGTRGRGRKAAVAPMDS